MRIFIRVVLALLTVAAATNFARASRIVGHAGPVLVACGSQEASRTASRGRFRW